MKDRLLNRKVCVIGLGPAGLGFARAFAEGGRGKDILCIEQGSQITERVEKKNRGDLNELISGFGGASLFSGSKLSLYPAGKNLLNIVGDDVNIEESLNAMFKNYSKYLNFNHNKLNDNLMVEGKAEYSRKGFDYKYYQAYYFTSKEIFNYYQELSNKLLEAQVDVLFNTKALEINKENEVYTVTAIQNDRYVTIRCEKVVLAVGRLGKNLIESLNNNLHLNGSYKKFDIGVRIEFPTCLFSDIDQFHNDLRLYSNNCKTFCVCKNGTVIQYSNNGIYFTEGILDIENPTRFTNLGILYCEKDKSEISRVLKNVFKKLKERSTNLPIRQYYKDFIASNRSNHLLPDTTINSYQEGIISDYLPKNIFLSLAAFIEKFVSNLVVDSKMSNINIFFPEINYGFLQFNINRDFLIHNDLYLLGECTGEIVGILQSELSGKLCAQSILHGEE